ncbi:uncharacterized protein LOC117102244 isoform X2 [Anneissia japonica]|uniref:uncharacterized protein LOC117102244 isoform X1 n=1 Tax=Anneissia japonica TaxID=1529436 RepID=UPI00142580FC|nr:uncharacterized protein LOC117102244 isoform X1 [Anneissia japonica]XP_033098357.1 uncharacterized protein LOC117102244 isoform X2 [Anneissia japonica]
MGIRNHKIREKLLNSDKVVTLDCALTLIRAHEHTVMQLKSMNESSGNTQQQAAEVNKLFKHKTYNPRYTKPISKPKAAHNRTTTCHNCGGVYPHKQGKPCPAAGQTCHSCGKRNHFAKYCRSRGRARAVSVKPVNRESSDEEYVFANKCLTKKGLPSCEVEIAGVKIKAAMKANADKHLHAKPTTINIGDKVLIKQKRRNILDPPFNPETFVVVERKGNCITAQQGEISITRNCTFFKKLAIMQNKECITGNESQPTTRAPITKPQLTPTRHSTRIKKPPTSLNDYVAE